jgi:Holliday junction resolvase RusA-like endonuclease
MTHRLKINGHVPSKKNLWKRRRGGGMYLATKDAAAIEGLLWQVKSQWQNTGPLWKPRISATFFVVDGRSDLDNKWTAVQDVLVAAGVIANDSIACLPGPISLQAATTEGIERVEIELESK